MATVDLGNSDKAKTVNVTPTPTINSINPNPQAIKPVAEGTVVKESFGEKLYKAVVPEKPKSILNKFVFDILIPAGKRALYDGITSFFGYGAKPNVTPYTPNYMPGYSPYVPASVPITQPIRTGYGVSKIIYQSIEAASAVYTAMKQVLDTQKVVTVAAYYEFSHCGQILPEDYNYGWTDLSSVRIMENPSGGYYLTFPSTIPLRR